MDISTSILPTVLNVPPMATGTIPNVSVILAIMLLIMLLACLAPQDRPTIKQLLSVTVLLITTGAPIAV